VKVTSHEEKGLAMITHKAGLHKDVAKIFDGVWTPEVDNVQFSVSTAYNKSGAYIHAKPLAADNWPETLKVTTNTKQSSVAWSFFSKKARREKKRLSEISRHLLINMPD
jgi:hypothetical protein